jgi:hypothetical protein
MSHPWVYFIAYMGSEGGHGFSATTDATKDHGLAAPMVGVGGRKITYGAVQHHEALRSEGSKFSR